VTFDFLSNSVAAILNLFPQPKPFLLYTRMIKFLFQESRSFVCNNFNCSINFIYCSKVGPNKRGSVKVLDHDNIPGLL